MLKCCENEKFVTKTLNQSHIDNGDDGDSKSSNQKRQPVVIYGFCGQCTAEPRSHKKALSLFRLYFALSKPPIILQTQIS